MAEYAGGAESPLIPVELVKAQIRSAMAMGFPVDESDQPTFHFVPCTTSSYADSDGKPFDWSVPPAYSTRAAEVQVLCACEFSAPLGRQGAHETAVGQFNPTTLIVTLL